MTNATVSPAIPANLDKFLSPESMITPGFAASFIVVIASALDKVLFIDPVYCALGLSMLISIAVAVSSKHGHPVARVIYTVLNALFIFAMAVGGATLLDSRANAAELSASPEATVFHLDASPASDAGGVILAGYQTSASLRATGASPDRGRIQLAAEDRPFIQQWVYPNASRKVDPVIGVRVRIFYCCGRDTTARRAQELLTARGADVLELSRSSRDEISRQSGTIYYYRDSHRKEASEIAELLSGVGTFRVKEGGGLYNRLTNAVAIYLPPG